MALVVLFLLSFAFADELPPHCREGNRLPDKPVQDQDGLGMCYASSASLLLHHNQTGLTEAPSAIQLATTFGAINGANRDDFFFDRKITISTPGKNGQPAETSTKIQSELFLRGGDVCGVINTARDHGFCDYSVLGFDFVGSNDPVQSQERLLRRVAQFLANPGEKLQTLRRDIGNEETKDLAVQRLAAAFQEIEGDCSTRDLREFIARRILERRRQEWLMRLSPTRSPPLRSDYRADLQRAMAWAFQADGQPTPQALALMIGDNSPILGMTLLSQLETLSEGKPTSLYFQNTFDVRVGQALGMGNDRPYSVFIDGSPSTSQQDYLADYLAFKACEDPDALRAINLYDQVTVCQQELTPASVAWAEQIVDTLTAMAEDELDPQAAIVNLLSPGCAAQMRARSGDLSDNCDYDSFDSASGARNAKEETLEELCGGRAVAITVCTGFMKSKTPVNSRFCSSDAPGVDGHALHGMVIVGHRLHGGRRQYLVQNSWGRSCPFEQHPGGVPSELQPLVECEREGTAASGRFWVDEDLLFNNMKSITTYRPEENRRRFRDSRDPVPRSRFDREPRGRDPRVRGSQLGERRSSGGNFFSQLFSGLFGWLFD